MSCVKSVIGSELSREVDVGENLWCLFPWDPKEDVQSVTHSSSWGLFRHVCVSWNGFYSVAASNVAAAVC